MDNRIELIGNKVNFIGLNIFGLENNKIYINVNHIIAIKETDNAKHSKVVYNDITIGVKTKTLIIVDHKLEDIINKLNQI